MANFKSEADVRAWLRNVLPANRAPRWVEPAMGSTQGLPDCFIPAGWLGCVQWIELKFCAEVKNGEIRFAVKPEQKREIPRMLQDGFRVSFLIGLPGRVIVAYPTAAVLDGRIQDENNKTQQNFKLPLETPFDLLKAFDWMAGLPQRLSHVK